MTVAFQNVYCVMDVKYSEAVVTGRGSKLDDGLRKSTECLATILADSALVPASMDRATSQPNLLALGAQEPVSSSGRQSKSPGRHQMSKSVDDAGGSQASKDVVIARPVEVGSDVCSKSPSRHQLTTNSGIATVMKEDGNDSGRDTSEDMATDKVAVIDKTLAKVMSGLKAIDAIGQNTTATENVIGRSKNDGQQQATAVSETVPIVLKMVSTREDRKDEVSSFASFSKKKSATLPKAGNDESSATIDADSLNPQSDTLLLETSTRGQAQSPRLSGSRLSRSDSAPQRNDGLGSASFPSNVGPTRYDVPGRAIPAATPVVPAGAPAVPPKPSKKPTVLGPRPSNDGKSGGLEGKWRKK